MVRAAGPRVRLHAALAPSWHVPGTMPTVQPIPDTLLMLAAGLACVAMATVRNRLGPRRRAGPQA